MKVFKKVNSVNKAMEILDSYTLNKPMLGITELSKKLEVSKSTIHRLITTMQKKGFLEQDPETRKYKLGLNILRLSEVIYKNNDIRTISLPIMHKLRDQTEESVYLNIISQEQLGRICIAKFESYHGLKHSVEIGKLLPLHVAASGKILLAYQDEGKIRQVLNHILDNGNNEKEELLRDLKKIREQGYGFSVGERIPGASSLSAPIKNNKNRVIAGLTISGPTIRFTSEKIEQFIELLLSATLEISRNFGYQD